MKVHTKCNPADITTKQDMDWNTFEQHCKVIYGELQEFSVEPQKQVNTFAFCISNADAYFSNVDGEFLMLSNVKHVNDSEMVTTVVYNM